MLDRPQNRDDLLRWLDQKLEDVRRVQAWLSDLREAISGLNAPSAPPLADAPAKRGRGRPKSPSTKQRADALYGEWRARGYPTLDDMGRIHGVTRERIRQVLSLHPDYERDLDQARATRHLERAPEWVRPLWDTFCNRPIEFEAEREAAGKSRAEVMHWFRTRWPGEFHEALHRERATGPLRRLRDRPNLMKAWEHYKADESMTFERVGKMAGMSTMGAYRALQRAVSADEFYGATSGRTGKGLLRRWNQR